MKRPAASRLQSSATDDVIPENPRVVVRGRPEVGRWGALIVRRRSDVRYVAQFGDLL